MTAAQRAERTARIQAARAERGQPPLIESEVVYRILDACISNGRNK